MSSHSPRKRRNQNIKEANDEEEPEAKTCKYSAFEFRTKLKGPDPIEALKQFLKDEKEDKMDDYIRNGGNLSELLAILNKFDVKKNVPQAIPVFQAITLFIIKSMSNFPEKHKELVEECRQLLLIHLPLFHTMLTAVYSPRQKKVALKLLTAVISCDEGLAWDILTSLKLVHQDIEALAFARKKTDPTSVREHFIRFLMSFLIDQPTRLIRTFISQKGLLVSIFSALKSDSYQDVILVLTTLKSNIVDNKDISKSLKLSIFNTASICHLIGVYSWDPRANISHPSQNELCLEGLDEVRGCLHELLLVLLTSVKMGVVFNDPSIGTTHREFNELVTTVISGFGKPWGDEMREDLFVKMLSACPDVIKQAYRQMDSFLSDINSPRWIQGLAFFTKLMSRLDMKIDHLSLKARTNLVKSVFVPPVLVSKLMLSIKSDDVTCQRCGLTCLATCLTRLLSYSGQCSSAVIENYLVSNVDCATILVESVEKLSSETNTIDDNSSGLVSALDCLLTSYGISPRLLDSIRYKKKYYDMLEHCLKRIKSKLDNGESVEDDAKTAMQPESNHLSRSNDQTKLVSLKIIELLLIVWPLDSSQDNFEFWLDDLSRCISPHQGIVDQSLSIVKQILASTGYFSGPCERELDIWMYSLSKHISEDSVKLVVKSIKYTGTNIKKIYSDLVTAEKMMTLDENSSSPLTLDLDDYIKASQGGDEAGVTNSENVFSLSVPFLSMLKLLHKEKSFDNSYNFVISLIVHLLHRQANTEMLVAILKLYGDGRAASSVVDYAQSWSKHSGRPLLLPPTFQADSVFHQTSLLLLRHSSHIPDISDATDYELELLLNQAIYYLVHGCEGDAGNSLVRAVLTKSCRYVAAAIGYQPVVDAFQPLRDLATPSNSTLLVLTLLELSSAPSSLMLPYQHRLAFELRYALRHKSALKDCHMSINKTLNAVGLSETDLKHLFQQCCPLPKKVIQVCSQWRPIQEFLLKEAVRLGVKTTEEALVPFLDEVLRTLPNFSGDDDVRLLDALYMCLEHNFQSHSWSEDTIRLLSGILREMIKCKVWSEKLSVYLYDRTVIDLKQISLERLVGLLETAAVKLSPNKLSELIASYKSDFLGILTSSQPVPWIDKLSSALNAIDLHSVGPNLKDACLEIAEKQNDIHVSNSNVQLLHALFYKTRQMATILPFVENCMMQPCWLKDYSLGKSLAGLAREIILDNDCCLSADLEKNILATGLKERLPELIILLCTAVKVEHSSLTPKEIFALLTSHSLFLSILLSKPTEIKYEVLSLLENLLNKDSSLIKSSHLPVYFSAYHATLSKQDQLLLQILNIYEKSGVDLGKFKPYVWGEAAAQKYSVNQNRKHLDDESGCPTIQLLDLDVIHKTIKHFPINRPVCTSDVVEFEHGDEMYDLVFVLGALSQVVGPNSSLYPSQIPSAGVISLAFLSLGSLCPGVRAPGYHILHRYYTSLTHRKDDQIWSHLIEKLRRSICGNGNVRINGPLSVFLARASLIMSDPQQPLYQPMHKYILVKSVFTFNAVPAFLEFFHSTDPINGKLLQSWILEVVRDGLRNQDDLQLILSSFTNKLLMDFYCSKLATRKIQVLIEEIVEKCLICDWRRHLLIQEYSLVPWFMLVHKYKRALEVVPKSQHYAPLKTFIHYKMKAMADANDHEENLNLIKST